MPRQQPDLHTRLVEHVTLTEECRRLLAQCEVAKKAGNAAEAKKLIKLADGICGRLKRLEALR
jgi:hypothetical protein